MFANRVDTYMSRHTSIDVCVCVCVCECVCVFVHRPINTARVSHVYVQADEHR